MKLPKSFDSRTDTETIRTSFRQDGFVRFKNFLDGLELTRMRSRLEDFVARTVPTMPREHVFCEEKGNLETLKQLQHLEIHDALFAQLMFGSRFEELARLLLEGPVLGKNVQYFCKPPGIGRPTPPHQDGFYFMLSPCEAVTLWLALDVVGKDNGCVRYVRGSHLQGMRQHCRTSTLGFSQGVADYGRPEDLANEMPAIAEPGDLLAHHALTIHRADANRSPARTRRALGLVYFSARAQQDAEAHQQYQQQLMEGLAKSGRI